MERNLAPGLGSGEAPVLVRLGGKLVLEVLPAALASAIGAFLFAQYQFDRSAPVAHAVTPAVAVPASAEMLQLVREEHALIRDFLTAQRTAEQNRILAANAADAQANPTADAKLAAAAPQPAELPSAAEAVSRHDRTLVAAASAPQSAAAALPPIVIAGARPVRVATPGLVAAAPRGAGAPAQTDASLWPPAPPPAQQPSIVAATLAVPGHVVSVTLHAVMAIGGIPSWIGHRFGDDDMSAVAQPSSSAS
ncbi:MAG TPA: hypothetical protein VHD86_04925 [Xanthobacteraceae bacterium]|nr:hypothetical protein [Xanthobacteraceae bacterium]